MLTQLLPDQISKFWPIIKYAVEASLPPTVTGEHPDRSNRILSAALSGKVEVWVSYERKEGTTKFEGVILTQFIYDFASNVKNLLIYTIFGYAETDSHTWIDGLATLAKYAKETKCNSMIAYAADPKVVENARKFGANVDYTFISFDLSKIG